LKTGPVLRREIGTNFICFSLNVIQDLKPIFSRKDNGLVVNQRILLACPLISADNELNPFQDFVRVEQFIGSSDLTLGQAGRSSQV
jgi:hypothetical protein